MDYDVIATYNELLIAAFLAAVVGTVDVTDVCAKIERCRAMTADEGFVALVESRIKKS